MATKVNLKRAPAQKSAHQATTPKQAITSAVTENAGPAGSAASEVAEASELTGIALSANTPELDVPAEVPGSDDEPEAVYLQEDITTDVTLNGKSGKTANSAKKSKPTDKAISVDPHLGFNLVISDGKALKLNPKTNNHVFFELGVKVAEKALYVRMSGNEGGGLHSKEWLALMPIFELIEKHQSQSFKSTIFNPLFKGSSANNAGFLGAVLRSPSLGLLKASDVALYQHQVPTDYAARKASLMAFLDH